MQNNSKKRILIFSTAYYPFVGGAEVAVKEITDRLNDAYDFDLITAKLQKDLPNEEKIGSVNVYRLGSGNKTLDKILLPFRGVRLIKKLSKNNNYHCFWAMMITWSSMSAYLYNLISVEKVPIVLTLQEGDSESHLKFGRFGFIGMSWKIALRNTKILTGISNFLIQRARKNGYKGESFLVPNGVDLNIFAKDVDENIKIKIKEILGKKDGEIYLVTTGRLTYKNATDDIIRALERLPSNIHLIIIGKGEEGPNLQKQADLIGVSERVKFLGFVDYKEIPNYLSVCDIFIRPSRSEGFGNSFIEAMACKLPVIATPVGGIVDFLSDRQTGLFCYPDNPNSIVNAVKNLIDDFGLRESVVNNAYTTVCQRYGWDKVSNGMKSVFDKVI